MRLLELVIWHDKTAIYRFEREGVKESLHIGPGESSYGPGWTAIMVGAFSKWQQVERQVFIRKHSDSEWYSASEVFGTTANALPIPRLQDRSKCITTFFDTVYNRWLNDLMLQENPAAPEGA